MGWVTSTTHGAHTGPLQTNWGEGGGGDVQNSCLVGFPPHHNNKNFRALSGVTPFQKVNPNLAQTPKNNTIKREGGVTPHRNVKADALWWSFRVAGVVNVAGSSVL